MIDTEFLSTSCKSSSFFYLISMPNYANHGTIKGEFSDKKHISGESYEQNSQKVWRIGRKKY